MMALANTTTWENRESVFVPASIKSLPHLLFLDHYSLRIVEKSREAMENVHQTDGQNTTTIELFPTEAFNSNSSVFNTRSRDPQFK